jgi:hypothetical protein
MLPAFEIYPFAKIPAQLRKRALVIALILTVLISIVMGNIGIPLSTPQTPGNILDFEFAQNAREARRVMTAWGPAGLAAAQQQTYVDFVYLLSYGLTLSLATGLAVWVWARRSRLFGWLGVALSWGALLAAALDALENVAMLRQWSNGSDNTLAMLAYVCAAIKFILVIAGLIYALFGAALQSTDGIIGIGKLWYQSVVAAPETPPDQENTVSKARPPQ